MKYKSRRGPGGGRKVAYPALEQILYDEFKELRQKGMKVKAKWFFFRAEALFKELYPDKDFTTEFKQSDRWFNGFKRRHNISFRSATNKSQAIPPNYTQNIRSFHQFIRRNAARGNQIGPLGQFCLPTIANMDQTPLQFDFNSYGKTYDTTGAKTVWVKSTGSGLDKRQCTVQHTIHADGIRHIKPLIVFKGTGQRISQVEKNQWDRRVEVDFQKKAWVDEKVFLRWCRFQWKSFSQTPPPHLLVMDVHKAQKTDAVKKYLRQDCNTIMALIPPGKLIFNTSQLDSYSFIASQPCVHSVAASQPATYLHIADFILSI